MKPEQQRIAIAEACGWKITQVSVWEKNDDVTVTPPGKGVDVWRDTNVDLPDYLNDLNAMALAENWLRTQGIIWVDYENQITKCATAPQRAEAFLRTIGKWKD